MRTPYNFIAGQSVERLTALCDGVFAVAMTLLVLDLRVPTTEAVEQLIKTTHQNKEYALLSQLAPLGFRFIPYMMSFLTLGVFWVAQQTHLNHLIVRSNRHLTWIHIGFLLAVTLIPFSTGLLAEFMAYRIALVVYWFNLFLIGVALFGSWHCAMWAGLMRKDVDPAVLYSNRRRNLIAQAFYAFGALLCIFSTYVSIAFIFLVQLYFVIAPPLDPLWQRIAPRLHPTDQSGPSRSEHMADY
ncbi:MAG TPA: TMEM175 family protein [Xanthobacteraceae bacterium]|nr:TMEM175 family protein [Xanthobacteraceae bacterium]